MSESAEEPCTVRFAYITASSRDEALSIGRYLVEQHLAACVNVLEPMTSIYWWEGKLEQATEAVLIAKTTSDRLPDLVAAVKSRDSYDCPCVVALKATGGNPEYLDWLIRESRAP